MSEQLRLLSAAEEQAGYAILVETVAWLRREDIQLWAKPLPREVYAARQARGENYGLFVDGALAVVVSLVAGVPAYWAADVSDPRATWLCTLATAEACRGRGLGRLAVEQSLALLAARGETLVCLDCKPGYLETLYLELGFRTMTQRRLQLPHGPCGGFEAVLMVRGLSPGAERRG